ncbi:unnamed protein product [Musa hybrid cultivar]
MWRRVCVASCRPALRKPHASAAALALAPVLSSSPSWNTPRLSFSSSASGGSFLPSVLSLGLSLLFLSVLISRSSRLTGVRSISLPVVHVSGDGSLKKRVVVMPIVMPFSILLFLGKKRFDMDASIGPFGTKEAPAVIEAYYDKRIVGCTGGDGGKLISLRWLWHSNFSLLQDKHDLVWFWLEKGKPHECRVCSQCYVLEVIGEGGPPDDEVDLEVDGEGGLHVVDHEVDGEGGP